MCCAGQPRSALTKLRGKVAAGTLEGPGLRGNRTQGGGQLSACWAQGFQALLNCSPIHSSPRGLEFLVLTSLGLCPSHTRKLQFRDYVPAPPRGSGAQTCPAHGWGDTQGEPHAHLPLWPVTTPRSFLPSEAACPARPHTPVPGREGEPFLVAGAPAQRSPLLCPNRRSAAPALTFWGPAPRPSPGWKGQQLLPKPSCPHSHQGWGGLTGGLRLWGLLPSHSTLIQSQIH